MTLPRHVLALVLAAALPTAAGAQLTTNPFPTPIRSSEDVIAVDWREFATVPDVEGEAPRMMHLADEPATRRVFVSTMRGGLYGIRHDGSDVALYLDLDDPQWGVGVQSAGSERGFQSFALHPQFAERGARGYGKFYTYTDTPRIEPVPDFAAAAGAERTHDTVLLEWTAKDASASSYDGGAPRELMRVAQPFRNHNGGEIAFNPLARPGSDDFGLLYVGSADGGSGGDPMNLSQDLASIFGKILRIDPLGSNSANRRYGIPASNPFVAGGAAKAGTLGEIYAYGVRNPQRLAWDPDNGRMFVADIGQNAVEEVSLVTAGANLGWNLWEASFKYVNRQVDLAGPRGAAGMTWPIVEYDHQDPLLQRVVAITGVYVYRQRAIPQLSGMLIFGDNPSGEIFVVSADALPGGGQDPIRRVLLSQDGARKTLLQIIREKNAAQGKPPAARADLRFGVGAGGQVFLLNKRDGVIRVLAPPSAASAAPSGGTGGSRP